MSFSNILNNPSILASLIPASDNHEGNVVDGGPIILSTLKWLFPVGSFHMSPNPWKPFNEIWPEAEWVEVRGLIGNIPDGCDIIGRHNPDDEVDNPATINHIHIFKRTK